MMRYRKLLAIALPIVLSNGIAPIAIAPSRDNSAAEFERLLQQRHDRPNRTEPIDRLQAIANRNWQASRSRLPNVRAIAPHFSCPFDLIAIKPLLGI